MSGREELIVAGVMSGTSADGVDVALVRLTGRSLRTRFELILHRSFPYPAEVREAVLRTMNARSIAVSELARLNFLLAEIYADCMRRTARQAKVSCDLVGCHGQTIYHQGEASSYLGRKIACTWQTAMARCWRTGWESPWLAISVRLTWRQEARVRRCSLP